MNGCAVTDLLRPKAVSPNSGQKVTREKLEEERDIWLINMKSKQDAFKTEVEIGERKWSSSFGELEKNEAFFESALQTVSGLVAGNPTTSILSALLGLSGLFYGGAKQLDNSRKDAVIEDKKQENRVLLASVQPTAPSTLA
jgi:hypothetical protein